MCHNRGAQLQAKQQLLALLGFKTPPQALHLGQGKIFPLQCCCCAWPLGQQTVPHITGKSESKAPAANTTALNAVLICLMSTTAAQPPGDCDWCLAEGEKEGHQLKGPEIPAGLCSSSGEN